MRDVPAHWVRANESTRVPRCWVWLDCEAHVAGQPAGGSRHTFRLAVTAHDCRNGRGADRPADWRDWLADPEPLWRYIDGLVRVKGRTILACHNLAYDLQVSRAFTWLPALGWRCDILQLDGRSSWASWWRGGRHLVMIDTLSWLPASLERIGAMVDVAKPPLPAEADPDEQWLIRCTADVEIMRTAMRQVVGWIEGDDMGVWKPTGAGMAWAAWRHRFYTHRVLAHRDAGLWEVERRAAWTGRCEAWRHGELAGGPWTEYDWHAAYATVASTALLPAVRLEEVAGASVELVTTRHRSARVLAEVDVVTEVPCVPAEVDGRIAWPVGSFTTTLWDSECRLVAETGGRLTVRRAFGYTARPVLRAWAEWVLDVLDRRIEVPDTVRLAVKHWSRALVGRFGSRWCDWRPFGPNPDPSALGLGSLVELDTGARRKLLTVGDRVLVEGDPRVGDDYLPSVMGAVMADTRVMLWRTMLQAGLENLAYCDTDSVIVNRAGAERLEAWGEPGLVRQGSWRSLVVLGPRQLVRDGHLKAAGVPTGAVPVGERSWWVEVWRGLGSALAAGDAEAVATWERRVFLRGVDFRRTHLADGSTAPVRLPVAHQTGRVAAGGVS